MGNFRTRNWVFVFYPESAPENWKDIISDWCIPCFVSPLHDQDLNPDGEVKKPHYHCLLMFHGMQTQAKVKELADQVCGVLPQGVKDSRAMARYLCHLDQPSKHQYDTGDVLALGGADYAAAIASSSDKYQAVREMLQFCDENHIIAYCDLLKYASLYRDDWFRALCDSSTVVIKEYLKSIEWKNCRHA